MTEFNIEFVNKTLQNPTTKKMVYNKDNDSSSIAIYETDISDLYIQINYSLDSYGYKHTSSYKFVLPITKEVIAYE